MKVTKKILSVLSIFIIVAMFATACSNNQLPVQNQSSNTETSSPTGTVEGNSPSISPTQTPETSETPGPTITPEPTSAAKEMVKVKAVYVSGSMAGSSGFSKFIELVNTTELNSLVIDIKEGGFVNYDSQVPLVKELGLGKKNYKVEEVLKKCHDNNIHVIGRIVVFRDKGLANIKTEYAIKKTNGSIWTEGKQGSWTNPYLAEVQDYNIAIAKEAVELGFDEIQFDYVRFPTAKANEVNYGDNVPEKTEAISMFLKKASKEIKSVKDVPVSADIFGIVIESDRDGKAIGQKFEMLGQDIDYVSPMIYPSHYANDSKGTMGNGVGQAVNGVLFTSPDLKPYDVIYQSLLKAKQRISEAPGFHAKVRPYLQDFTAKYLPSGYWQTYGKEQVRDQIKAVYDAGYEEWILWNGSNIYTKDALLPKGD